MDHDNLDVLSDDLKSVLQAVAEQEKLTNYNLQKVSSPVKGEGYMSEITRVRITGEDKTGKTTQLNLVVKNMPTGEAFRKIEAVRVAYEVEIYMYTTIFETFAKFQREKGVDRPFSSTAKCYLTTAQSLVLENLSEIGYKLCEKRAPMNTNHVKFIIQEYAKFHALSFALNDQNLSLYERLTSNMKDAFGKFLREEGFLETIDAHCKIAAKSLNATSDKKALEVFQKFMVNAAQLFVDIPRKNGQHFVIVLGDSWCNNMMFKYADANNPTIPTNMCFLDFQGSCTGSPVLDISHFLFNAASKESFNNVDYYLNVYYTSLSNHMQALGSDASKVFPFSTLKEHWKTYAHYGLTMSCYAIHATLSADEELPSLSDIAESGRSMSEAFSFESINKRMYYQRIRDVILHCVENNLI